MIKKLSFTLPLIVCAFLSTPSYSVDTNSTFTSLQGQSDWLDSLPAKIEECHSLYVLGNMAQRMKLDNAILFAEMESDSGRISQTERNNIQEKVLAESTVLDGYKRCEKEDKPQTIADAKAFIAETKDAEIKVKIRKIAAQWLTALDSISSSNYDADLSDLKLLTNDLKLELTLM